MEWRVKQDGLVVASGFCDLPEVSKRAAAHYALMYAQDGSPVEIWYRTGKRWKRITQVEFVRAA